MTLFIYMTIYIWSCLKIIRISCKVFHIVKLLKVKPLTQAALVNINIVRQNLSIKINTYAIKWV